METTPDSGYLSEYSDPEWTESIFTPYSPVTPATSPRRVPRSLGKHLKCPHEGCTKAFNRPARLEEHKRSHANDRIFKCTAIGCTKDFLRNTHLKRHVEANHTEGPKPYLCKYEDCNQSFVTNQRLKRHHDVHEKRDKYRCTVLDCGSAFRKHNTLDQHIRTAHQGQAAFPCDEILVDGILCQRGFGNSHYLKLHKGRDHGVKSYFCTICATGPDSSFGTFSDLQAHNKIIHPPVCDTCGFVGKTNKEIASHVKNRHTGTTLVSRQTNICPFTECGSQGFVEKRSLKIHIRTIHEEQKLYQCEATNLSLNHVDGWDNSTACGKAFSHKATLENHIRSIHMGLESMQKQRFKRKADSTLESSKAKKRSKVSKLDLLTGTGMTDDPRRTIPCSIRGCDFVFMREWDKIVHLHARHGIPTGDDWILTSNMDEEEIDANIAQLLDTRPVEQNPVQYATLEEELEASAAQGGQFWVGGLEKENDLQFDPFYGDFRTMVAESEDEDQDDE